MDSWVCVKCRETASSKCPGQRSVFLTDQVAAMISNYISVDLEIILDDKERSFVEIDFVIRYGFLKDRAGVEEFMNREAVDIFFERLDGLKKVHDIEGILRRGLCDHRWVLTEGTTCTLGCTHMNYEQWKEREED